jgi:hypothetical protein
MELLSDSDSQWLVGGTGGGGRRRRQLSPIALGGGPTRVGRGGRRGVGAQSLFSQMTAVLNQINIVINIIYGDSTVSVSQFNVGMIDMSSVLG